MKRQLFILALGLTITVMIATCKEDNPIPPEEKPQINLTLEDTSCTEAWIKLTTANISLPAEVILKQDDSTLQIISLSSSDSLLYFDSLLPNHTYEFQSIIQSINQSSNSLTVTTMDTTSHNFTWQTWTFGGQAGSCTLYDVAIIDENNIWAVGEIYVADTSQIGYTTYNAVHWDGSQWELKRILYNGNFWVIRTIFAFSENDIWFSAFVRYDGKNFIELPIPGILMGWNVNKIWGSSSNDLYAVGGNGNIVHYQNGQWSIIESGTDLNIQDIYGVYDNQTNNHDILAVASDGWNEKILQINDAGTTTLQDYGLSKDLHGIWFVPERRYYIVGAGIFQKHSLKDSVWTVYPPGVVTNYYSGSINGNGINDLFVTGAFFEVVHFNGANWFSYRDVFPIENGTFGRAAIKSNLVVMVGFKNQQAIIAVGER